MPGATSRRQLAWAAPLMLCLLLAGSTTARKARLKERLPEAPVRQNADTEAPASQRQTWMEVVSWEPRAIVFHQFLSDDEVNHLVGLAKPHMKTSEVVDNLTGKSGPSKVRTSSGMFLNRGEDEVVSAIEARIQKHTALPAENGEGLQILHYRPDEEYRPHFDYFHDTVNTQNGGQRIATMLMYLSDVEEGGETSFPDSREKPHAGDAAYSPCAQQGGVAVKAKKGDALLFYSLKPNGEVDPKSLHAGCPVLSGDKWSATKWLRVGTYDHAWLPRPGLERPKESKRSFLGL